jgi:hypothetical protein
MAAGKPTKSLEKKLKITDSQILRIKKERTGCRVHLKITRRFF